MRKREFPLGRKYKESHQSREGEREREYKEMVVKVRYLKEKMNVLRYSQVGRATSLDRRLREKMTQAESNASCKPLSAES